MTTLFRTIKYTRTIRQGGYLLPVVIALGLGISTISVIAMRTVTENSTRLTAQYYDILAREAAQSGIAAVKACVLSQPSAWAETMTSQISSSSPLTPQTDCSGAVDPLRGSVSISGNGVDYETTYRVTSLQKAANSTTIYVTSVGEARVKAGSRVVSTVQKTVRAMATSIKPQTGPVSKDISMVSTGPAMACALTNPPDSWVYCWGDNGSLQLGANRDTTRSGGIIYPIDGPYPRPLSVATNTSALARIAPSGCTGSVVFGNCLFGSWRQPEVAAQPASAMAGKKVTKVSVGVTHVCAVATESNDTGGKAYCWGKNTYGQLGNQSTTDSAVPVQVNDSASTSALRTKTVVDVVAGESFSCARTSDNDVSCWGLNSSGQLGNSTRTNSNLPVTVSRQAFEAAIPAQCNSWYPSWVPFVGGTCNGWTTPVAAKPASALIGKQIKSLAQLKGQLATMCVITIDDKSVCWGENFAGQVGNGSALPPSATGTGSGYNTNGGQCQSTTAAARSAAISDARSTANVTSYDALRPVEVQTSLVFGSLTIVGGSYGDTTYVDVIGKIPTAASTNPDRLYNWGGAMTSTVTTSCQSNSDTYGGDSTRAQATARISFVGRSTPSTASLYNTSGDAPLNGRLGLTAGNPVRGLFCATVLNMNQPYCDVHNGTANQGQLGNNYTCDPGWKTGSNGWPYYDNCDQTWNAPQSVRLDIASDLSGPANPTDISSRQVSSMDSSSTGFTCMTAQASAWCWGIGGSGQIGDTTTSNRKVPAAVNYSDGALRIDGMGSGDPATWENPLWF